MGRLTPRAGGHHCCLPSARSLPRSGVSVAGMFSSLAVALGGGKVVT